MSLDYKLVLRLGIQSVLRNAGASLSFSWPWLLLFAIVSVILTYFVWQSGFGRTPLSPEQGTGTFLLAYVIGMLMVLIGICSIAVLWHRFILLDEFPGVMQRLRVDAPVWRYVWRAILIGLLAILICLIPMILLVTLMFSVLSVDPMSAGATQQLPIGTFIVIYLFLWIVWTFVSAVAFRFCLALADAALGQNQIGIFESWRRTKGLFGSLLALSACVTFLNFAWQIVLDLVFRAIGPLSAYTDAVARILVGLPAFWFFTFLGITLITSLYGHIVQKRPL